MTDMQQLQQLAAILRESRRLVVFTGAGISCPSGIPDFRSASGLYNQKNARNIPPEEIISHHFFLREPEGFYRFYREKMLYPEAKPNAAHLLTARLETAERRVTVVTQNIDGLHSAAGSTEVCELHGSVHRNHCLHCRRGFNLAELLQQADADAEGIPHCPDCGGIIKPDVVLYEEGLDDTVVDRAIRAISAADTMVIIGTSLVVYPAASYLGFFRGRHLVLVNLAATAYDSRAELAVYEDCAALAGQLEPLLF